MAFHACPILSFYTETMMKMLWSCVRLPHEWGQNVSRFDIYKVYSSTNVSNSSGHAVESAITHNSSAIVGNSGGCIVGIVTKNQPCSRAKLIRS